MLIQQIQQNLNNTYRIYPAKTKKEKSVCKASHNIDTDNSWPVHVIKFH